MCSDGCASEWIERFRQRVATVGAGADDGGVTVDAVDGGLLVKKDSSPSKGHG